MSKAELGSYYAIVCIDIQYCNKHRKKNVLYRLPHLCNIIKNKFKFGSVKTEY